MESPDRYLDAFDFALSHHGLTLRKSGARLAMTHPVAVCEILRRAGIDDAAILAAALLHDVLEDTPVKYDELFDRFGARIADTVVECSDDVRRPRQARRAAAIDHARSMSRPARLIKLADTTANLEKLAREPPRGWTAERTHGYVDHCAALLAALAGAHPALETRARAALDQARSRE